MHVFHSDSLRARASLLASAAERFVHQSLHADPRTFRGGAEGLLALCRAMNDWLYQGDVSEESERQFVEGAGALLGVLLLEHDEQGKYEARDGRHRIRLGRYGYFDPFAAIDRALDADDVRAELARQVHCAEQEARARGPVSRVIAALLDAIERERGDLTFAEHFDTTLWLQRDTDERIEVDLRRAIESTRDQDESAVARAVERLVAMLPGAKAAPLALEEIAQRMVPRLARRDALGELEQKMAGALFAQPYTDELAIALLLEYSGRARYVSRDELTLCELTDEAALELARENLALRSATCRLIPSHTPAGPLLVARTGDGRDSARVLLEELYTELAARVGERVFVGLPHRDTFFACGEDPALRDQLARRTAEDAERAPHRLSARIFELTNEGLRETR